MKPKKLAKALQALAPGLAYQSALRIVTTREAPTVKLAAALTEVLASLGPRSPPFGPACAHCGGPMMMYIDSSKMLFDPAPAVTRWVETCERRCEGSRR